MLQQEAYLGKITWSGKVYAGLHQPLIAPQTFERVQAIFASKTFTRSKTSTQALLAKKVFCACCKSPLAPSHTTNRHKQKYYYYRCTGSKDRTQKCQRPHFSLLKLEARVSAIILSLSEQFSPLENKLLKHNDQVASRIQEHEKALHHLEGTLSQLKQRKDKYLDTLLSSQFLSKERELISTKITEMETEEKHLRTAISKQETQVLQTKAELLPIAEIKKRFITYRSEYPFGDSQGHRLQLNQLIERIDCQKDSLAIRFKMIPEQEHFDWLSGRET